MCPRRPMLVARLGKFRRGDRPRVAAGPPGDPEAAQSIAGGTGNPAAPRRVAGQPCKVQ